MNKKTVLVLSLILLLPLNAQAIRPDFLEIGPRFSVSFGPSPLTDYWAYGVGIGGSVGYSLRDDLVLVTGLNYRYFPHSGGAPVPIVAFGESNGDFVRIEGQPGPFADASSIIDAAVKLRMYFRELNRFPFDRPYISVGVGSYYERLGDIAVFVQGANDDFVPYQWNGGEHSGGGFFFALGFGFEVLHYGGHPINLGFDGHFGIGGQNSAYLPIKLDIVF